MSFHLGGGDDVEVGVEKGRDDTNGNGLVAFAEDVAILPGLGVEIDEADVVFFGESGVAISLEALHCTAEGG